MEYVLRKARIEDRAGLSQLIAASARGLSRDDYSDEQIEASIETVFGVDTDLIRDETYFVAEVDGEMVGCGGWSKRKTLFGGDQYRDREPEILDPEREPAKIRAFFVHPDHARQGIGRAILNRCEAEAHAAGYRAMELMATLPGLKMYRAMGYQGSERVTYELRGGVSIEFVPMKKELV